MNQSTPQQDNGPSYGSSSPLSCIFLSANWELTALTSLWKQMVAYQWRTSRTSCDRWATTANTNCPLSSEKCLACLQERLGKGNDCYIAGEWWKKGSAGPLCYHSHWAFSSLSSFYFLTLFPPLFMAAVKPERDGEFHRTSLAMKCRGKRGQLQTTRPVKQSAKRIGD